MFKTLVAALCFILPSAPTRFFYRLCGHRIGRNVRLPLFSYINAKEMTIGNDVEFKHFVFVDVHRLAVGASSIISYGTQIKGAKSFTCGDCCFLGLQCVIHCHEDVSLGFYSGLGPRCTVYTHGSFLPVTMGYPAKFAPVVVEDYVWIAMEVTIMAGARIGRNCIINPGVVVQGTIRPNSLVQIDPHQYLIQDLDRLQKISQKAIPYWHHKIISDFLNAQSVSYRYDEEAASYTVPGRYMFRSRPEANEIELLIGKDTVRYDLAGFFTDRSRHPIHKKFLFYIRLHHGLTLRTRDS